MFSSNLGKGNINFRLKIKLKVCFIAFHVLNTEGGIM